MATKGHDRLETLKKLSPLQAIQALLHEDCGHGEARYLIAAIQRDRRIELDDDEIAYVLHDAMESGVEAPAIFDRLLTAGDACRNQKVP